MDIIVCGWVGLFGTSYLAKKEEKKLNRHFSRRLIEKSASLYEECSLKDFERQFENLSISEIGEDGIFGTLWDVSKELGLGVDIELDKIPIRQETIEITEYFDINPYKIASKGAYVLFAEDDKIQKSLADAHIPYKRIGATRDDAKCIVRYDENTLYLTPHREKELIIE